MITKKLYTGEPNKSAIAWITKAYLAFSSSPHPRCLPRHHASSSHLFSRHSSPSSDLIDLKHVSVRY